MGDVQRKIVILVGALAFLAGCDCAGPTTTPDGGVGIDSFVPPPPDGGRPDAPRDAGSPDAAEPCITDLDCSAGLLCFGGFCQADPCQTDNPCMGTDERCRALCVNLVDPCEGVVCGPNETCVGGECFPGCLPVTCEGVSCPSGQFCDPSTGACRDVVPCDARCGDDRACHFTCTPRSACEGVTCGEGEFCRAGECLPNPCFGVVCEPGEVCQNGTCIPTCACDPPCTPPERCIGNRCVCVPRCPADATCGTPDGCGGFCPATCPGPREECNPDTGLCECIPSCAPDAACGDSDGCGGRCPGTCADGRACVDGRCECTDVCLGADAVDCGVDVPDTCMGSRTCAGTGTRCPAGETCIDGSCCSECATSGTVACGTPIPPATDDLGRDCRACPGVGSVCPAGLSCVDPPGGGGPTARVCCGACASPSSVPCGMRIPDVRDASGAVCRTCTGFGTAGCTSGSSCTGGSTGICCENCAAATAVDCGTAIPSPTCRTCTGFGSRCPSGTSCTNPPGTSGAGSRTCCASCPSASTVACGVDVPDVLTSDGRLCRDCGRGTACPLGSDCLSGSCCPRCPTASTVDCGMPIPDAVDAMGRVCRSCGTGTRCAAGSTCIAGVCCPGCAPAETLSCGLDPVEPPGCAACPNGTSCPAGERCRDGSCCAPTCTAPSTRACGSTPSDGCGGTCSPGTLCTGVGETCTGEPLRCTCTPSCVGRRCGEADGCGGECIGTCAAGFVCAERPPPARRGDYECEPSACIPSCGLCQSCILGRCEPLTCAPGETVCLSSCQCCGPGQSCTPRGCVDFG